MVIFFSVIFGLVFGSFLNVCIYRIPRGENIAYPPSHCTWCKAELKPWDLIPVVSFCLLRGKCRYCGEKIHLKYPLVELANAIGWGAIVHSYGLTAAGIAGVFLFSVSLVITVIDLEHYIIPDVIVVLLLTAGIIFHLTYPGISLINRIIGLAAGFTVPFLLAVISKGGMGGGDIKLSSAMGFWLGFPGILYALFASALLGSICGIFLMLMKLKKRKEPIPFGPFLVMGFMIMFFYGVQLVDWYWNLF